MAEAAEAKLTALQAELAKKKTGCINCGETNDGGYMTEEVGPFCSECWVAIHADDTRRIAALQAEQAQWQQKEEGLVEEIDCLCQAIEGHRGGALTNDGLWHYWTKAKKLLAALTAQQGTPK